jgi:hypothetical protein
MLKKYFGLLSFILGIISILSGFIFINKIINQNHLAISDISILVNTFVLGIPAIIYGLKFIGINKWKNIAGNIIVVISMMHVIYLLLSLFYIKKIPENMVLTQGIISFGLLIYGWLLKEEKIIQC